MSTRDLEPLTALAGQRIVEAGHRDPGDRLTLPAGPSALWLVEGEAAWDDGRALTVLAAGPAVHPLKGPGTVAFRQPSLFVWLDGGDPLGFGARAPAYRQFMESKNVSVGRALADGLDVRSRQIWVDIGTGTGAMVQALRERAAAAGPLWIVGVDRAAPMLDEARRHADAGAPAWLVADDVEHMAWPEAMLDGVTALLLLHLVDDLPGLLARLYGALKPGGQLAYAVSAPDNPFVRMVMQQVEGPGDFFRRGADKIQEATQEAGFEIVRTLTHRDDIVLEDGAAMRALLGSIGGPASRGLRTDAMPPPAIERKFTLVWARKAPTRRAGPADDR